MSGGLTYLQNHEGTDSIDSSPESVFQRRRIITELNSLVGRTAPSDKASTPLSSNRLNANDQPDSDGFFARLTSAVGGPRTSFLR